MNLLNNPLEFPPVTVVNKGIKYVKEYLKANCKENPEDFEKQIPKSIEPNIISVNDDMWASDSDEEDEKRRSVSPNKMRKNTGIKKKFEIFF